MPSEYDQFYTNIFTLIKLSINCSLSIFSVELLLINIFSSIRLNYEFLLILIIIFIVIWVFIFKRENTLKYVFYKFI
jgi:hypothetical protein